MSFYASTHTHLKSVFDADVNLTKYCQLIKKMGGQGFVLTDHGVLSAIEDAKEAADAEGIKFVPGVEAYIEEDDTLLKRQHLILIAKDDIGYKAISQAVTASNRRLKGHTQTPCMNMAILKKYFGATAEGHGHVFATSACMAGVINRIILQNDEITEQINKLSEKQRKNGVSPTDESVNKIQNALKNAIESLNSSINERDTLKALSEMRFVKREKALSKMTGEAKLIAEKEILKDKQLSADAKEKYPSAQERVKKCRKQLSAAQSELDDISLSVQKWISYDQEINAIKDQAKSEDEIMEIAKTAAKQYVDIFGKGYFLIELQYHGIEVEGRCMKKAAKIADELRIPMIAANDVHMLDDSKEERIKRQILRSMRYSKPSETTFLDENPGDSELYTKTDEQLKEWLLKILPEDTVDRAIANIRVLFDKCNVEFKREKHYPKFKNDSGKTVNEILDEKIQEGIKWRFPDGMDSQHHKRLEYELSTIKSMGYADYHLIVQDCLEYGRLLGYVPNEQIDDAPLDIKSLKQWISDNNWRNPGETVSPGRGSAVGSIVCYILGITNLDPIKYDLLFERFLNPERVTMPDIDCDYANRIREQEIRYVKARYGEMAVCAIMTTNAQGPKGVIRIAAKYYGIKKYGEAMTSLGDLLAKKVPTDIGVKFNTLITPAGNVVKDKTNENGIPLSDWMLKTFAVNKDAVEIIHWAIALEGIFTTYSSHAAGIVISDNDDVSKYIPLRWSTTSSTWTTQCNMVQVENNGLLKFDFLGLKTLDINTGALRRIEKRTGKIINMDEIDMEDSKVFENIFCKGQTEAVFQFASPGMRKMLVEYGPKSIEDLIILVSMYRPGPMQYLDDLIKIKNGKKNPTYLCPELEPILGKTYSAIVYQEQVMKIFQDLAGYSLGQADMVRRYMSKKKEKKLIHEKKSFIYGDPERNIKGCVANGISEQASGRLFDQMIDFAKYAFNKSHAAAYAVLAYQTAWLKYYYPKEFFCSALDWADKIEDIRPLMYDASKMGIKINAPDINRSQETFEVIDDSIMFGLSAIRSIKSNAQSIISERKNGDFLSLKDFYKRTPVNKAEMENLIDAGAFDRFGRNRLAMKNTIPEMLAASKTIREKQKFISDSQTALDILKECVTENEFFEKQQDVFGKVIFDKMTSSDALMKRIANAENALGSAEKDFNSITVKDVREDKNQRMENEKDLLGIYITAHPMDFYPKHELLGYPYISDAVPGDGTIYGVVSNLRITKRKKDGRPLAFFELEDKSGSIPVCVWTKEYAKFQEIIQEGHVIVIHGDITEEESYFTDENDMPVMQLKMSGKDIRLAHTEQSKLIIPVRSYADFHMNEDDFRKKYELKNGHPFVVYDELLDEMREITYRVSDEVKKIDHCKEIFQ